MAFLRFERAEQGLEPSHSWSSPRSGRQLNRGARRAARRQPAQEADSGALEKIAAAKGRVPRQGRRTRRRHEPRRPRADPGSGSIAAYKAVYLLRELGRLGAAVAVCLSEHARIRDP